MKVISMSACNQAFNVAFGALQAGQSVRRSSWPEGQRLRVGDDGRIAVYRNETLSAPWWAGPSCAEMDAADWVVVV
jgi:hypothetical protein